MHDSNQYTEREGLGSRTKKSAPSLLEERLDKGDPMPCSAVRLVEKKASLASRAELQDPKGFRV